MSALETAVLRLGTTVVTSAIRAAIGRSERRRVQSSELVDLIRPRLRSVFESRAAERQAQEIADQIASRMQPLMEAEFAAVPDGEKIAAFDAVVDTLASADLSDERLFSTDFRSRQLARELSPSANVLVERLGLSSGGAALFELVMRESCQCFLGIIISIEAFSPRGIVEVLSRQTQLSSDVAQILSRLPRVRESDARFRESEAESDFTERYRSEVCSEYDQIELFGIDTNFRVRVPLEIAYVQLWTQVGVSVSAVDERSRVPVAGALSTGSRFLIQGDAGSGKSTLLQWLAVSTALGDFVGDLSIWNSRIPFMIKLRNFKDQPLPSLANFIAASTPELNGQEPDGWTREVMSSGRGLLLVDGFDEVPEGQRGDVEGWLSRLFRSYPSLHVVVTSRPSAVKGHLFATSNVSDLFIERMVLSEIGSFVRRWHAAVAGGDYSNRVQVGDLARYEASLLRKLALHKHLYDLAANPLLCALICALHLDREGQLPTSRREIYEQALDLFLERRDQRRGIEPRFAVSKEQKVVLLQELAWFMTLNELSEITAKDAEHRIIAPRLDSMPRANVSAEQMLGYLINRSGLLNEPRPGTVGFVHRTFQEFLAAKVVIRDGHIPLIVKKADDALWREVALMAAANASLEQTDELIVGLLARAEREADKAISLKSIAALSAMSSTSISQVLWKQVTSFIDALVPPRSVEAAKNLAAVGEVVIPLLPEDLSQLDEATAAACVHSCVLIGTNQALRLLGAYALDSRDAVMQQLVAGWDYFDLERFALEVLRVADLSGINLHVTTSRAFSCLRHVASLRSVVCDFTLGGGGAGDGRSIGFDDVSELKHTELASLSVTLAGQENLPILAEISSLQSLSLRGDCGRRVDMEWLGRLSHLRHLGLERAAVDGGLQSLRDVLFRLESLTLISCDLSSIAALEGSQIRELCLEQCHILDLTPLSKLHSLVSFKYDKCALGVDLSVLNLEALEDLSLIGVRVLENRAGLRQMPRLKRLVVEPSLHLEYLRPYLPGDVEVLRSPVYHGLGD